MSFPRARNLLRYFLAQQGAILPSTTNWKKFCVNCCPHVPMQRCRWCSEMPKFAASGVWFTCAGDKIRSPSAEWSLSWQGEKATGYRRTWAVPPNLRGGKAWGSIFKSF